MKLLSRLCGHTKCAKAFSERHLLPFILLLARLKVGSVFLISGWLKLGYVLHDQIDSLYAMFDGYKVPLLPTHLAAWLDMSGEIGFSILLALGLMGRLGALGLIIISGVIYNTDGNPDAVYWALICAIIAAGGSGKWSLDALICRSKGDNDQAD